MRITQIQGLRAVAAILVTVFHARLVPGGFIGVDIFYVISGYLITGLILREIEKTGTLDLRSFYQRRIKRLLPTSVFVLFVTAIFAWILFPPITRDALGRDLFAAAAYISNYLFAWWQNDYQNLNATPSPFIHYWSLAVEEQFYLVWPLFILFLARYGKKIVFAGIAITTLLSLLFSIYLTQVAPIWAFYSLPTRAWELGFGALLLFLPETKKKIRILPWLGFFGIAISSFNFNENTAFPGKNALVPVLATVFLMASIKYWPPMFNDLANSRLSQWLGAISYPLYLWHWPALVLPSSALGRPLRFYERFLCILLTIVLAHYTSKYVEEPLRHKNLSPRTIYKGAAYTTAVSLVAGVLISFTSSSIITTKGEVSYQFDLVQVMERPGVYGDGCHVNYGETKSGYCTYGDKESSKTIVLYGDSHAAQWFPTLEKMATERGFKLVSLTKSACPAVDAKRPDQGAFKQVHCTKWRENSIKRIAEIQPLAVITSSFQYFTPSNNKITRAQWWNDGQRKLLKGLRGSTNNLIYISDTPRPLRDIPNCLASRDSKVCDSTERSKVSVIRGFDVINPNPWLCSSYCPAIVEGTVSYRDASHISVDMALKLLPKLEAALIAKGLFA
ncbi:acyltransferase [Candidatus Planktophila vernalis]|uniref:Acyltransferase n=1 Tax=Candidatus Planktophila vernalis TaxID=1884907 RepID=A0A249KT17_9ACTN|nr:acyltransferase family protein [Candidatus Planktophila vernalis]ASY19958.1 acyltransferase [Candidatus Planktophila vernalis]